MKAFLLAAGEGTRLRPLTLSTPKCLIPIGGMPLLGIWFRLLEKVGVRDVLINTHYLPDKVAGFIKSFDTPIRSHLIYEPELLGSAGTILKNREFVQDDPFFWIVYADSYTTVNLRPLLDTHLTRNPVLTIGVFHTDIPKESGIITLDPDGRIIDFVEKPSDPPGDLSNTGIMVASPALIDEIPNRFPSDLSYDVLPRLKGRMCGRLIDGYFIDIGTQKNLRTAQKKFEQLARSFRQSIHPPGISTKNRGGRDREKNS